MDPEARAAGLAIRREQLATVAVIFWEVEACLACGEPEAAKRLTWGRYWARTRRPAEDSGRVISGPARAPAGGAR